MASPFSKYTGEQVQPINILPATTEMARQRYESIANFGKEIGSAIEKYGVKNQERIKNSMFAAGIIGNHLERDPQMTDENDKELPPVISATAPAHIVKLYKKAESEGDGDWVSGMANVSGLEIEAFLANQGKWEKDEQVRRENDRADATLRINQAGQELAERKFKIDERAAGLAYEQALFNFQRLQSRAATDDEVHKAESELKLLAAKYAPYLNEAGLEKLRLELAGLRRTEGKLAALDEIRAAVVPLTGQKTYKESEVDKVYGQYELNGQFLDSFDLAKTLKEIDPSLTLKDIDGDGVLDAVAPVVQNAVTPELQLARKLAGDPNFVPPASNLAKDVEGSTTSTSTFTRNMYNWLLANFPENAEQIKAKFLLNPKTGGLDKNLGGQENSAAQFETAMRFFRTPTVQSRMLTEIPTAPVNSPASKVTVLYTNPYTDVSEKTITYQLDEQTVWDAKIAQVKESFAKAGKPWTLSNQDVYRAVNLYGGYIPFVSPRGEKFYMGPDNKPLSESQFASLGVPTTLNETEWQAKQNIHNTFLKDYVGTILRTPDGKIQVKGGRQTSSGWIWLFNARDPNNPIRDAKSVDFGKVEEFIGKATTDLNKVDAYIDRMSAMWDNAEENPVEGFYDVVVGNLFGGEWNSRYTANQRGLETFRKYFIAPGTETERDAERLADQMAEPKFQLWVNPDVAKEILALTRGLIVDAIRAEAEAKGFTVIPPEGIQEVRYTPEQRTAIKNRIAEVAGLAPVGAQTPKK